ncbi:MAG: hypothetical protein ACRD21_05325, partial [Vicinamibacteria bacterium]
MTSDFTSGFEEAREAFARGWEALERLPLRSKRTEAEAREALRVRESMTSLCAQLTRAHRRELYERLTDGRTKRVRVDDLVYLASDLWPGLVPTRKEVERE